MAYIQWNVKVIIYWGKGMERANQVSKKTIFWHSFILIATIVLLLIGRYDWQNYFSASIRSYFCSLWLAIPITLLFYGFLCAVKISIKQAFFYSCILAVILALPHHWLKLRQFYKANRVWLWNDNNLPAPCDTKLFSAGYFAHSAPFESFLFIVLLITGLVLLMFFIRKKYGKNIFIVASLFWGLLVIEAFFFFFIHSPYCNNAPYVLATLPDGAPRWYHCYLFEGAKGAVTLDYFYFFRDIEILFAGIPHKICDLALNRPFPFYLISHMSVFINSYYVMIVFNLLLWAGAALSLFLLIRDLTNDSYCAILGLFFMGCSSGFIMNVSQPPVYVAGYAVIVFIYWFYIRTFIKQEPDFLKSIMFGLALGLTFLTYEHFMLVLCFLVLALLLGKRAFFYTLCSIFVAAFLYKGFILVAGRFGEYAHDPFNENIVRNTFAVIMENIARRKYELLYMRLLELFPLFLHNLINVFFLFPVIAAILALFLVRDRRLLFVCFAMILPFLCNFAFLHFGKHFHLPEGFFKRNVSLSEEPRLLFGAYPVIYLLASYFCVKIFYYFKGRGHKMYGLILAGIILLLTLILANMDVIGFRAIYLLVYFQKLP